MNLEFKPLGIDDLKCLHAWFQEPTINALYAQNRVWSFADIQQKYLPRILGQDNTPSFIIFWDKKPIGFIQYYALQDHLPEGIDEDSELFLTIARSKCVGIDIFIADASIRGKNYTPSIINAFIREHCSRFDSILVDPAIQNHQAIYCYTKAGFLRTEFSRDSQHMILMKTRFNQTIQLDLLSNHPQAISQLALIWLDVLGKVWLPQIGLTEVIHKFKSHLNHDTLPLFMVALDGDKPVGGAALRTTDGIRPELTPWLASLVVDRDYQGRQIGRLLVDAIKQKARYLGFDALHLLTFDPNLPEYYQKLGFESIGQDCLLDLPVTVMMDGRLAYEHSSSCIEPG